MSSSIGVREAKAHLSGILKKVQQGIVVVITDRGRPVGKIVPIPPAEISLAERIRNLEAREIISPAKTKRARAPIPVPVGGHRAQEMLREDREA